MKISKLVFTAAFPAALLFFAATGYAQDVKTPDIPDAQHHDMQRPHDRRANFLHKLGLSPEQMEQIRQINLERRPLIDDAQKRLREANRALDAAIYAEQVNESDFEAKLKDVQSAQAEVARIRFTNELAVRRVLTPEQLARFREMRQRFEQERRDGGGRRGPARRERGGPPQDAQPGRPAPPPDAQQPDF
jgi:Spy/CpxP family protein refolding chaperone